MKKTASPYSLVTDSPLGRLGVKVENNQVRHLDYLDGSVNLHAASGAFERNIERQLENYFENPQTGFSLPLALSGTPFQQRVWQALTAIPAGETLTYGELAASLGSGARAVGNACRHNPVPVIVPCHRVVAAAGIGGYSGKTRGPVLDHKYWLLAHESRHVLALKKPA